MSGTIYTNISQHLMYIHTYSTTKIEFEEGIKYVRRRISGIIYKYFVAEVSKIGTHKHTYITITTMSSKSCT